MDQPLNTAIHRDIDEIAAEASLAQCVASIKWQLHSTPIGWILVAWLASNYVPPGPLLVWLGFFSLEWSWSMWKLYRWNTHEQGISKTKRFLITVAALDGMAWGAMVVALFPYSEELNSWMTAILCGIIAVNVASYITYITAFRVLVGTIWLMAIPLAFANGALIGPVQQYVVGLSVFFVMVTISTKEVARKVTHGIRMQIEKDALAERLAITLTQTEQLATRDALTGQANRRALDRALDDYMARTKSSTFQFAILMMDIDWFKNINDKHGHSVGDEALKRFSDRANTHLRSGDMLARYGGEEFVLVMPDANHDVALKLAQRLRADVCASPLMKEPLVTVTVSIGIAESNTAQTVTDLLFQADAALYLAKKNGRNQVWCHQMQELSAA